MSPYLSFVVTSRNDDDDALQRMQIFIDSLAEQVEEYKLSCELIIVEWNYPADRPRLIQALAWPPKIDHFAIRMIGISPELHGRFENSQVIPLFQMIAKNAGIRRAHGAFVLATNVDILFSNEVMEFFAAGSLDKKRMYRIDRYDVPAHIPANLTAVERMDWCRRNVIRLYRHMETVEITNGIVPARKRNRKSWLETVGGWFARTEPILHTNACGDFTLLSKECWEQVYGYPEFPLRAMKLDGLLCYAAHYSGARECVLKDPARIYHLDHASRSDGALVALSERDARGASYQVSLAQYRAWVDQMRASHHPIVFNKQDWGFANEELPETTIE